MLLPLFWVAEVLPIWVEFAQIMIFLSEKAQAKAQLYGSDVRRFATMVLGQPEI